MSDRVHSTALPFLFPQGMPVPSSVNDPHRDEEDEEIESIVGPPKQRILNDRKDLRRSTSDLRECTHNVPCDEGFVEDADTAVRDLLAQIIDELQSLNDGRHTITEDDARSLRPGVSTMFEKTTLLADIDVAEFSSNREKTTCFAINLANLMWLHTLIVADERCLRGVLSNSWPLRHIHLNSVGYIVGRLGFVTLHDLYCLLFNLPSVFRTKTLSTLNVLSDPRIHFLVAQPNVFSPTIEVVSVDTLENMLEESKNDYLRKFVIVQDMKLFIPMPLLMFIERVSDAQNADLETMNGSTQAGGSGKLNILTEILHSKNLPYEKLLSQDIHLLLSTRFKIKFSHTLNELDDITTLKTVVWRSCRAHRSLYLCLVQLTNIVRSTMLDDHLAEVACACPDRSKKVVCVNNTLLTMAKIFRPLLNEFHFDGYFRSKGLRCLYAVLVFGGVALSKCIGGHSNEVDDSRSICKVIEADLMRIPTWCICAKIKMCSMVLVNEPDAHSRWPRWFDVYFADPNAVLIEIVEYGNATLACMWMAVELKYKPDFEFSDDANKAFDTLLGSLEDVSYVKQAYAYTADVPLSRIVEALVSSNCAVSRLQNLVSTILSIDNLSEKEQIQFHSLFVGLQMISCIELEEQTYYYKIAYNPQLIVEQLILNKRVKTLKEVLTRVTPCMLALPEKLQQEESLSRSGIDDLLRTYAEKSLHFRRTPAMVHCQSAALKHALLFKDGGTFYPPQDIPKKEDWVPHNWAVECFICKKKFSLCTRRQHCRRCGRVVCRGCSSTKMKLIGYNTPQKVCEPCRKFEEQFGAKDGDSSQFSRPTGSKRPLMWILDVNPIVNTQIRDQAIFDTAPDIELYFSLLELHTENGTVPRFLCASAKIMLKILRQRLICPANFDYSEVSHITKSLLSAAKVYYVHLGDMQGVRQCEELISESVLLNRLAETNFIPQQLNKPLRDVKEWQYIMNILLEHQHWDLALEVSTKNGLECESIWYLWGMHVLKSGDRMTAREKFARSNLKRNANMVNSVLEVLQSNMDKDTSKGQGLAKFFSSNVKWCHVPKSVFDECLYYLERYGSGEQLFDFFVQYNQIFEAVRTVYAKKIAPKKFLQRIYIPHLQGEQQAQILKYMEKVDPTKVGWKAHAEEICRYCSRNRHFQALYEMQLWIEDYCRAALSCTMFYRMDAKSYADLQKNKHHLETAMSHFEVAIFRLLDPEEGAALVAYNDREKMRLYVKTVNLQKAVANFVCMNSVCIARTFESVPTIFGNNEERLAVILLLTDACADTSTLEAFHLTLIITRMYRMVEATVFTQVVLTLLRTGKEGVALLFIEYVKTNYYATGFVEGANLDKLVDVMCSKVIRAKPQKPNTFLDLITNNELKFDMQIECGYLKSAYVLAAKMKRADLIEKTMMAARGCNKLPIVNICEKKLQSMSSRKDS